MRRSELPFLQLIALTLHFDQGQTVALNGVNLQLRQGEFVALTGASGSGKSSLLNLIGTLESPTSGEIILENQPYQTIKDRSCFRRENFGFIFQAFHLLPTLNVLENVMVATLGTAGVTSEKQAQAESLLTQLGLKERLHHFPNTLSGGERQRVAIARALINQPKIILADEPTGNLDSKNTNQVLDLLENIVHKLGMTLIMVTHDSSVSARADRLIFMRDGRIETDSTNQR